MMFDLLITKAGTKRTISTSDSIIGVWSKLLVEAVNSKNRLSIVLIEDARERSIGKQNGQLLTFLSEINNINKYVKYLL